MFPRRDRISRRPSFSKYQKRCPSLSPVFLGLLPLTKSPLIFHSPISFTKRIGIPRETKRPDEISPRRGEERPMQSVLLRRTPPAFELSRHPCPLTRNYREGTPGTRTRKETSRRRRFSPVVGRGAFQETG